MLKSMKFQLALVGLAVVVANHVLKLELSTEEVMVVLGPIIAAILGTAYEDAAEKRAMGGGRTEPPTGGA